VGTKSHTEKAIQDLALLPGRLAELYERRRALSREIHAQLRRVAELYEQVYEPVQRFITKHSAAREAFALRFGVSIVDAGFEENFLDWINRARTGSFLGNDQAALRVRATLKKYDHSNSDSSVSFAEDMLDLLKRDQRNNNAPVRISEQLRAGKTEESLLDFLYGFRYLQPRYELKMGDRDLQQLSPGEKGALLLVFYLLVDQNDNPLVIDQPEENLDNQTIVKLLLPALRDAKQRRQIFIVTHNPNLAVVCDAEQVICAVRSSDANPAIEYDAGAIENPVINKRIVDVLEGTRPAFDNRGGKYHR
jgi:predicted ATPase